jgi:hypothetical protein
MFMRASFVVRNANGIVETPRNFQTGPERIGWVGFARETIKPKPYK